jgi:tRNA nucleotidyltransferase/poly(A) polymerase
MSDYMFILESHLSQDQSAALSTIQAAAADANVSLYLTGGAMRDMLGGFAITDLDFTVEGNAVKLAKDIVKARKATLVTVDEHRKSAEIAFPTGVCCEIAMARVEKYTKPGARPQITPATIHDDLRGRDFTMNAIGLSLNRASRGLMIDPTNGAGDIEHREIRATSNYTLYDDPARLLRLIRFKARFGFTTESRTQLQYGNAREAGVEENIPPRSLYAELRQVALETNPLDVLQELESEGLLALFSTALTGAKLNSAAFQKLAKAKAMIPFDAELKVDWYGLNLYCLTQKLTPKEKSGLIAATKMEKAEIDPWQKLEARAKKLETKLKGASLNKASLVYDCLIHASGEEMLMLHLQSGQRIVQDRIKNFLTKYLPTASDVTDEEVTQVSGFDTSHARFAKAREERIAAHLDGKVRKPPPPPEPEPEPVKPQMGRHNAPRAARAAK